MSGANPDKGRRAGAPGRDPEPFASGNGQLQLEAEAGRKALELLRWLAPKLVVRNANGVRSDKFCALCMISRRRGVRCRHDEIRALVSDAETAQD